MQNKRSPASVLVAVAFVTLALAACSSEPGQAPATSGFQTTTEWAFTPSVSYDALNFMNALSGDPFYTTYYGNSVREFRRRLDTDALSAMRRLYRQKRRYGFILSAFTTMAASTGPHETLAATAAYFDHPGDVIRGLEQTPNHRPIHGALFRLGVAGNAADVLRGLDAAAFTDHWTERKLPLIRERIAELELVSSGWNILPAVERRLGAPTPEGTVHVHVLSYARPHALKLAGNHLVVDMVYSDEIVVTNAIHELLHPPVDFDTPAMKELVRALRRSELVKDAFDNRGREFGYNQFRGYVEENIVRALEHHIAVDLGITERSAAARWRTDDGGMHVFAAILYQLMAEANYARSDDPIAVFLEEHFVANPMPEAELARLYEAGTAR